MDKLIMDTHITLTVNNNLTNGKWETRTAIKRFAKQLAPFYIPHRN